MDRTYIVKITKPATGEFEIVTVTASRDGQANTAAMMKVRLRFGGEEMRAYEVMADGSERRLLTGRA